MITRRATAAGRGLPHFLIIGAQRAGTSSLYAYLSEHPDIHPAFVKEVHFFDLEFGRGLPWYRSMFPLESRLRARGAITGEASPYYLFHPLAAERAAAVVPHAKLVVLLRDPVERAWSHYRHEVKGGRETLSFEDALAAEPERLARAEPLVRSGAPEQLYRGHRTHSYVARGRYTEQLEVWLQYFPREQFLALRSEDLFERPGDVWPRLLAFLNVGDDRGRRFTVHNQGPPGAMPQAARSWLQEQFAQPNADLVRLLGSEFSWG
jgi:hypothetical protein